MILPLYVCQICGKFGGLGLALSQSMAKASKGETIGKDKPYIPECEEGHGEMHEVKEGDRLHVLSSVIELKQKPLTDKQKKYIKLFLGDGYGRCTDGYLMNKLGVFEWKEAEKLIEQYKREEGMNE